MVQELCQSSSTLSVVYPRHALRMAFLTSVARPSEKARERHSFDSVIPCSLTGVAFNIQAQTDKPNQTAQCLGTSSLVTLSHKNSGDVLHNHPVCRLHPTTPPHATCHSCTCLAGAALHSGMTNCQGRCLICKM